MLRIFKKEQILTIPNIMSFARLLMIPLIVWLYCFKKSYYWAVAVIIISALTDIADGIVARKCNMVSDFGKAFDPLADKLTQAALFFCLLTRYKLMLLLIGIFAVKQAFMFLFGYLILKEHDEVNSAQWYGKVNTVLLYVIMGLLVLLPNMPRTLANILIGVCCASDIISFVMYATFYFGIIKSKQQ